MKSLLVYSLPLVALSSIATAAIVADFSFDTPPYTIGSDLNGQQGWVAAGGYTSNNTQVSSTGLTHSTMLGESGGSVTGPVSSFGVANLLVATGENTDSNLGSGEVWFTALFSMDGSGSADWNTVRINFDSSNSGLVFGLSEDQFVLGAQADNPGGGNYVSTAGFVGTQYTEGTTALIVGRMTVTSVAGGVNETVDLWFNPTDARTITGLNSTAQGTILGSSDTSLVIDEWGTITVGSEMGGSSGLNMMQDEIRVATDLGDLNLIPEPSAYGILLGGIALAAGTMRRR